MQDSQIVSLYWQRDETALRETARKYERYLTKIAYHILADPEDSMECVNDTYWRAWNSMPPHRPEILSAYLAKITRQGAIDRFRTKNREKRRDSEYTLSLSELEECVSGGGTPEQELDLRLLAQAISAYLHTISPQARVCFVGRYYYMDSVKEIAAYCGASQAKIKSLLYRTRRGLRAYLEQEGFDI